MLYNLSSWILLLISIFDIATSDIGVSFLALISKLPLSIINLGRIFASKECFYELVLDLSSPTGAFYYGIIVSNGYFVNNFALCQIR